MTEKSQKSHHTETSELAKPRFSTKSRYAFEHAGSFFISHQDTKARRTAFHAKDAEDAKNTVDSCCGNACVHPTIFFLFGFLVLHVAGIRS